MTDEHQVGCLLKSLLTSFAGELPINKLNSEYKTVVGADIPYKDLKYSTLSSFLQSIPDHVRLENRGGQQIVKVVKDKNIEFILYQVQGQDKSKVSKRKKPVASVSRVRPYSCYSWLKNDTKAPVGINRNNNIIKNSWAVCTAQNSQADIGAQSNHAVYAAQNSQAVGTAQNNQSDIGAQSTQAFCAAQNSQAVGTAQNNQGDIGAHSNQAVCAAQNSQAVCAAQNNQADIGAQNYQVVCGAQNSQAVDSAQNNQADIGAQSNQAVCATQNSQAVCTTQKTHGVTFAKSTQTACTKTKNESVSTVKKNETHCTAKNSQIVYPAKNIQAVCTRKKGQGVSTGKNKQGVGKNKQDVCTVEKNQTVIIPKKSKKKKAPPLCQIQQAKLPKEKVSEKLKKTFKQQLIEALDVESMTVTFQTLSCGKMSKKWSSVAKIGEYKVISYPNLSSTPEEAEETVSQKALRQLPKLIRRRQEAQLPTTTDYIISLSRVRKILEERSPNKRFWWNALSEAYLEMYNEHLPEDWIETLKDKSIVGLSFDNPCMDKWTVGLKNEKFPPSPQKAPHHTPFQGHSGEDDSYQTLGMRLPSLPLPSTATWDVFITCVEDSNTIQLRLVGNEYSDAYNDLLIDMGLHYMNEENQHTVEEAIVGEIYAASHEESWFRVEVLQVMGKDVKVKFIDHGDQEVISMCDIVLLQKRFFSLPAQTLCCCLAGLEDVPGKAAFQALVECLPLGQTLVAQVQDFQEPYSLLIFDTLTSEDINLNEKVLETFVLNLQRPSLPPIGCLAELYLKYASCSGIMYVQEESRTCDLLNDILEIAIRRTKEKAGEVQIDLRKLYLAFCSMNGEWHRAAPLTLTTVDGKFLMKFVDIGNTEKVELKNIKSFEDVCPLLAEIPYQVIPCCLHNVPINCELRWSVKACHRLTELAPHNTPLLLKVVSEGTPCLPPSVQMFKKLLPQNELVSINDTLAMDTKLFWYYDRK